MLERASCDRSWLASFSRSVLYDLSSIALTPNPSPTLGKGRKGFKA
ncbi:MAG: hypothetical protein AAGE92_05635 [Cyanobacteria bacterium P01_G01_bin.4]